MANKNNNGGNVHDYFAELFGVVTFGDSVATLDNMSGVNAVIPELTAALKSIMTDNFERDVRKQGYAFYNDERGGVFPVFQYDANKADWIYTNEKTATVRFSTAAKYAAALKESLKAYAADIRIAMDSINHYAYVNFRGGYEQAEQAVALFNYYKKNRRG